MKGETREVSSKWLLWWKHRVRLKRLRHRIELQQTILVLHICDSIFVIIFVSKKDIWHQEDSVHWGITLLESLPSLLRKGNKRATDPRARSIPLACTPAPHDPLPAFIHSFWHKKNHFYRTYIGIHPDPCYLPWPSRSITWSHRSCTPPCICITIEDPVEITFKMTTAADTVRLLGIRRTRRLGHRHTKPSKCPRGSCWVNRSSFVSRGLSRTCHDPRWSKIQIIRNPESIFGFFSLMISGGLLPVDECSEVSVG